MPSEVDFRGDFQHFADIMALKWHRRVHTEEKILNINGLAHCITIAGDIEQEIRYGN